MDHRSEVRDFLTSRRARLTPAEAGLPSFSDTRRVKGLRREEVAILAGVSVDYYNRMERGNLSGVSEGVLAAVGRALKLDDAERTHLHDLACVASRETPARRTAPRPRLRQPIQRLLDAMTDVPAYIRNDRMDILGANHLATALLCGLLGAGVRTPNLARYLFFDETAQDFYAAWETVAKDCVAALRIEAGRNPCDTGLTELVGELSTRSEPFRVWWAAHNVRVHSSATKTMHHPEVGDVEVTGEALSIVADEGLTVIVYTVEPASRSQEALRLLSSWFSHPASTP